MTIVREEYVTESFAMGWFCRSCRAWNGDEKEFLITCRCCDAPRPKHDYVPRFTRGK